MSELGPGGWADYFDPDEELLWEGQPAATRRIRPANLFLAAFGMPFLLAGLATSASGLGLSLGIFGDGPSASVFGGGLFLFFFGIPFIAAGVGMVAGPTYLEWNAHRKVRYALSNRHAYVATRWWGRKLTATPIDGDAPIEIEDDRSVFFYTKTMRDSGGDAETKRIGFENLGNAAEVYTLIRQIQANSFERSE